MIHRVTARAAYNQLYGRGYDGAHKGRLTDGWTANSTSADAEIEVAGQYLRNRMRDLARNNPHAAKAISVLVSNIVGPGITPRADVEDEKLADVVNDAWREFARWCDPQGLQNFSAIQTLACRGMIEGGEMLVRRRDRLTSDGLSIPLQIEVIEPDLLDETKDRQLPNGGRIVQGVEFDPIGRRVAYWILREHPGDRRNYFTNGARASVRVPADKVSHVYDRQRTQVRGVPWGAPVLRKLRDLDDWHVAELVRKKTEACLVATVIGADEYDQGGIGPSVMDADGNPVESMVPGMFAYARGAKDIKFNQPATSQGTTDWLRAQLHIIAAGYRVPYELMTGDLSQVNFSSIRQGLNDFYRLIDATREQIFIPMFCEPVWRWFTEVAFLAGKIPEQFIPVKWSKPKRESIEPLKDVQALEKHLQLGTMTWAQAVTEKGYDPKTQLIEIGQFKPLIEQAGIKFGNSASNQMSKEDEDNDGDGKEQQKE